MTNIIFFKEERAKEDPYRKLFEENGYQVQFLPVLSTRFVNLQRLKSLSGSFAGVVITSQKSVQAAALVHENLSFLKGIPFYCVGEATADSVKDLGFCSVGENTGNSEALADFIVQKYSGGHPLLLLTGDKTLDQIPQRLLRERIPFETLQVYETQNERQNIFVESGFVVVFSPSGLDSISIQGSPTYIAIGTTTSKALCNANITHLVCKKPNANGILDTILLQNNL